MTQDRSAVDRISDRELVVERAIRGRVGLVYEAWTRSELFQRWWVPRSFPITLLSCELDVRMGGGYKLVFGHEGSTMEFFGRYLEVAPPSRLVWTNEEGHAEPVTTVTFEERGGMTRVVVHELYPSKEALDDAIASGSAGAFGMPEQLEQLEELLLTLDASAGGSCSRRGRLPRLPRPGPPRSARPHGASSSSSGARSHDRDG